MAARHQELKDVSIYQIHTEGEAPYAEPEMASAFQTKALFVGPNIRNAVREGRGSYIPVFLSEAPSLFRRRLIPIMLPLLLLARRISTDIVVLAFQ